MALQHAEEIGLTIFAVDRRRGGLAGENGEQLFSGSRFSRRRFGSRAERASRCREEYKDRTIR
jgi:hypothetical protein